MGRWYSFYMHLGIHQRYNIYIVCDRGSVCVFLQANAPHDNRSPHMLASEHFFDEGKQGMTEAIEKVGIFQSVMEVTVREGDCRRCKRLLSLKKPSKFKDLGIEQEM